MQRICWLLAVVCVTIPGEALAQGPWDSPYGYAYSYQREVLSRLRDGRVRFRSGMLASGFYGRAPFDPYGLPPMISRIRIYVVVPPSPPPPVLVTIPPPMEPAPGPATDEPDVPPVPRHEVPRVPIPEVPRAPEKPMPKPPPPPPEKPPAVPPRKEEPKEPPKKEAPVPPPLKPAPRKDGELMLPRPPALSDEPREAHAQLIERGQESFKDLEYGRAVQRFRAAIRLLPKEPMPYFLLAQALVAQGKYHEAHDSILAGLRLRPDWPRATFRPLEMYGAAVGEYAEHLAKLQETLRRHPDDPVLLFLLGYQMWFDGRKEDAGPLFRRALPRAADRDAIEGFLRALPPVEL
jgi:tetratricopeptide (TPR) repeat protein